MKRILPALLLGAAVFVVYHSVLALGLLGHDTYPILLTSRIQNPADLLHDFTRILMDGRYPASFYRPLLCLSLALDQALFGLDPLPYQFENLLFFAASAVALFYLVRRMAGPGARIAPWAAALAFLLFPLQYEVLPVVGRRPETMAFLFTTLSILAVLSPRNLARSRPGLLAGFLALLAILSKETGFLVVPLSFLAVLVMTDRSGGSARIRHAARAALPQAAAAILLILVRWGVIGGLGGHADAGLSNLANLPVFARRLLFPQIPMADSPWGLPLVLGLGAALLATLLLAAPRFERMRAGFFAAFWTLLMLAVHAWSGTSPWYLLFSAAGFAFFLGVALEGSFRILRSQGRVARRLSAAVSGLLISALLLWQASYSPLFHSYPEWELADRLRKDVLQGVGAVIEKAQPGSRLGPFELPAQVTAWKKPGYREAMLYGASILRSYSVQAWAEIRFPEKAVEVRSVEPEEPLPPEVADRIQVLFVERYVIPKGESR
ncbi:MAG: hypothetical protein ACE5H3_05275 [Planctomycetota bacterium]